MEEEIVIDNKSLNDLKDEKLIPNSSSLTLKKKIF